MNQKLLKLQSSIQQKTQIARQQIKLAIRRYWFRTFLLLLVAFMVNQKDLSINLHLNAIQDSVGWSSNQKSEEMPEKVVRPVNTSLTDKRKPAPKVVKTELKKSVPVTPAANVSQAQSNLANTYSNLSYTEKGFATNDSNSQKQDKRKKQFKYINRFSKIATGEMDKFGIPASITLAQGLLESNVGESRLAKRNNNHFGIKCFSKSCGKGHCSNFTDDHHKDFFRKYKNSWESYRSHSYLLKSDRYKPLYQLKKTDYKGWAYGLKKAGYATDKHYAEKLINLIEELKLYQYDR